jgi:hypothetical protein
VRRQPPQFLVDQRQQLAGRVGIALLDGGEDLDGLRQGCTGGLNTARERPGPNAFVGFGLWEPRGRRTR